MLDTTNITRLKLKRDKVLEEYRKDNQEAYDELNILKRKRLFKINDMIYSITNAIEQESGWLYTPSSFTCLSDFSYTGKEIVYTVNTINSNEDGYYITEDSNPRELRFFTKYKDMLDKLFELEKRRKSLLPEKDPHIIPISRIVTREARIKDNKDNNMVNSFTNALAYEFVMEYKNEGIVKLVKLLNQLVDLDSIEPLYKTFYREGYSYTEFHELLRWAGLYTPRGQQLLDKIARDRLEKQYMLSGFPTMEERMTKNMIDLHL